MRYRKWLVFAGVPVLLLAFAAWQMPADRVLQMARTGDSGLSWSTAAGSAWNGQAENVFWKGLALGNVSWRMTGLESLSGPGTVWAFEGSSIHYSANGRLSMDGRELRRIEALRATIPAAWLDLSAIAPLVWLTGTLDLDLESVGFRNGFPASGRGVIRWTDAGLGGLVRESLGDIEFSLNPPAGPPEETLQFDFDSLHYGDIGVAGSGRIKDNRYRVSLRLSIAPGRPDLLDLLGDLGETDAAGGIHLDWEGELFP